MLNEQTIALLNLVLQVLFYSLIVAVPIIVILILMYQYKKYTKWAEKEQKEADRIIVKMNEDLKSTGDTINLLTPQKVQLQLEVDTLKTEVKNLKAEKSELTGEPLEDAETPEKPVYDRLTIKQLQALAKERKLRGYSRISKEALIKLLQ